MRVKFSFILIFGLLSQVVLAQSYNTTYGQNRIQYKNFDWVYYSTTHFDIYYYDGGYDYANQAIDFLEEEFNRMTDLLGYAPYSKTRIMIYNSTHDLQQSNIGVDGAEFDMGGQTDFVKLQLELAHPGSAVAFKQELVYKLSRVLIEDMMFGGSLAEIFQSSYLLSLPMWFIDGAARYLAYGWSADMDDLVLDHFSKRHRNKIINVQGEKAGLLGQSVWNYISLKYGKSNISNILNLVRIIRNEENAIASTLGVPYRQFLVNWKLYYTSGHEEVKEHYVSPDDDNSIVAHRNDKIKYKNVRLSASGDRIAYSQNHLGRYGVFVYDVKTGRSKKILRGGVQMKGQPVDYDLPLLSWAGDEVLGVVYFKRGFLYLATFNLETGRRLDKPLTRFNQVKSFSLNQNGRLAVLSGDVDGMSDIFLVSMRRNALRRITQDIYDDKDPSFVPGTAAILFSSNRPIDSLKVGDVSIEDIDDHSNIFLYDLDTTTHSLHRVTNTFSRDFRPIAKNQYEVFYLSDQRGSSNVFRYSFVDSTHSQVSNFDRNIKDYDLCFNDDGMVFLMLKDKVDRIFLDRKVDLYSPKFTPQTQRQKLRQARYLAGLLDARQLEDLYARQKEREEADTGTAVDSDSISDLKPGEVDPNNYTFGAVQQTDEEFIDTDNFEFEEQPEEPSANSFRPESFFSNYQRLQIGNQVFGPEPYKPQFSFNNLVTAVAWDELRGFGTILETQVSDMLGNHKMIGGGYIKSDFKNIDLYGEYRYLKYWMDLKFKFSNKTYFFDPPNSEEELKQKYSINKVWLGSSIPLSNWLRVEANPFIAQASFSNLHHAYVIQRAAADFADDNKTTFLGTELRAVFDNTVDKGYNITQGTRGAVEFIHHQAFGGKKTFSKVRFDLRHHQTIHKEITIASRIFYGHSFGPNAQKFLLGGVPNWINRSVTSHASDDPLLLSNQINNENILFAEFVNNMRGFNYSELFGSSSFLFNMEFRFPVFQYLWKGPISSSFLRNFILVAFGDLGSAWEGAPPITRKTSVSYIDYTSAPFTAEIANYRNPWLASYGYGLRTVLLGYYVKADLARPIRDNQLHNWRLSLSLGLDF
ncbi:MAG: translocation protein TolB [Cyclobacteriaceae bacterium]